MTPCTPREDKQFAELIQWLKANGLTGHTRKGDPLALYKKETK